MKPSGQYHLNSYKWVLKRKPKNPPGVLPTFFVTFLGAIVGEKALQEGILGGPWYQCLLLQQPEQAPCLVGACQRADLQRSEEKPPCPKEPPAQPEAINLLHMRISTHPAPRSHPVGQLGSEGEKGAGQC